MSKKSKILLFAAMTLLLSPVRVRAGAGPEIIPQGVPGGGPPLNTPNGELHRAKRGAELVLRVGVACENLRLVAHPVSRMANVRVTVPTNFSTIRVNFPTRLFFDLPNAPFTVTGVPAGTTQTFDVSSRRLHVYVPSWVVNEWTVSPNGEITHASNRFRATGQIGVDQTNTGTACGAEYTACDGPVSIFNLHVKAKSDDLLKISFDVDPSLGQRLGNCTGWRSPLFLSFDGKLPKFTGSSDFPLDKLGRKIRWMEKGAPGYWLALDKDRDGKISKGKELFGDFEADNGFDELAKHDSNGDGAIDKKDPVFSQLLLWQDRNGDGQSDPDELTSLKSMDVVSISLHYDASHVVPLLSGAELRQRSKFTFVDKRTGRHREGDIIDIFLAPIDPAIAFVESVGKDPSKYLITHTHATPSLELFDFSRGWVTGGIWW